MSEPTSGEWALAKRLNLDAGAMASARDVLNTIALLPWPRPERVSLLARLARSARADVGPVYAGLALDATPLASFDLLMPVLGLAEKRVAGLVQALSGFDVSALSPDLTALISAMNQLRAKLSALETENTALRTELDLLYAKSLELPGPGSPSAVAVMRLGDVASSVSSQVGAVDDALRASAYGLRLGGLKLTVKGAATAVDNDVALNFASSSGGSEVNLAFVPADLAGAGADETAQVPDVRGYAPALARRKLVASGFSVVFASVAGARGVVEEQSPAEGSLAPVGSTVRLIVR